MRQPAMLDCASKPAVLPPATEGSPPKVAHWHDIDNLLSIRIPQAPRSETSVNEVSDNDCITRKAGPLEETWIERHQKRTGCKCDVVVKKGFVTYICVKCGKEINDCHGGRSFS